MPRVLLSHWRVRSLFGSLTVVFDNMRTRCQCREKRVFVMPWQGLNQRHRSRAHGPILMKEGKKTCTKNLLFVE